MLPKSQLPLLTSAMMVTQAFLAAPAGLAAKKSLGARNRVILTGYAAMIAADLSFALLPSTIGAQAYQGPRLHALCARLLHLWGGVH